MKTNLTLLLLLISFCIQSQNFKFGKVSKEELAEKIHSKDPSANAAVLFKNETVRFEYRQDDGFTQIRTLHERIKIYNKEGFDWATKRVRLYNKSALNSEDLSELKGYTYNLVDGKIDKEKLRNNGVFEEIVNKYWKYKSFTMPNVKVGAILEYTYSIKSPYSQIDDINFQYSIPINTYKLSVRTPEYYIYNKLLNPKATYVPELIQSKNNNSLEVEQQDRKGETIATIKKNISTINYQENVITCNTTNIPALKDEPLVDNLGNYASKLIMELSMTNFPTSPVNTYSTSWEEVSKSIYNNPDFGNQINKTNYFEEDLDALISGVDDPVQKAFLIFNFVKTKVRWNDFYGYSSDIGVRKAYKEGVGNVADINLMLISMLRYAGISANPVMVSTKNNGIPLFPTRQGFNYVVCFLEGEDFSALLDATEPFSDFNILPERDLNWQGRLIKEDGTSGWINLSPLSISDEVTYLNVKINTDLSIAGKVRNQKSDYIAKRFRNRFAHVSSDEYIKYLEKDKGELLISDLEIENAKNTTQPVKVVYNYELSNEVEEVGGNVYFTPMLFLATKENPFKSETRNYPIDLSFPFNDKYVVNIIIPQGYKVESLPESKKIEFNGNQGEFSYIVNQNGNFLQLSVNFIMNKSIVLPSDYQMFKEFYSSIVETQNEKIVLKPI